MDYSPDLPGTPIRGWNDKVGKVDSRQLGNDSIDWNY
jgi:hypothetical protein